MVLGLLEYLTLLAVVNKIIHFSSKAISRVALFTLPCFMIGCAAPLVALSSSGTAAASSVGAIAVANPATTVSLASSATTGKSPLEHAASAATKKECSFFNIIDSKPICIEMVFPTVIDKSEPLLGPDDIPKVSAQ